MPMAALEHRWDVGITAPPFRLFDDHGVDREDGAWIFVAASTDREARAVESHFIDMGLAV